MDTNTPRPQTCVLPIGDDSIIAVGVREDAPRIRGFRSSRNRDQLIFVARHDGAPCTPTESHSSKG
jgi:hypothetical protein